MNYSILIELSRHTIAFSYSRDDGKNQFIPYGDELVKPLAIYSSGNELRIGSFAAAEARAGRIGAFDNIFDAIRKPSSFTYRGTQYPLNKLLLFGIEQCLREFFDSILYGTEGQLEQNTAKVPICLLMSSELTDNEQAYVVSLLRNAGYSNTFSIDYNSMVLDHVRTSLANNIEKAVFVSNVGNDLYIQCVDAQKNQQLKRIFDFDAKDAGKDPQIDQVVKLIWQEILYDENSINLEFDECLPELQIHAQRFLASGDLMCQNIVTLKGHSYEYFISKSSITNGIRGNDNSLGNLLLQLKSKNVEPTKTTVILLKSAAKNSYVKQSFCDTFPSVVLFDEEKHQEMLNSILEFVKKSNYRFPQVGGVNGPEPPQAPSEADKVLTAGKFKEARELFRRMNSPAVENKIAICTSCIKDERKIREFSSMPKEVRIREKQELLDIVSRWARLGVGEDYIQMQVKAIESLADGQATDLKSDEQRKKEERNSGENPPSSPVDLKNFNRKWRETKAMANGFLRERKFSEAQKELQRFIDTYKNRGADVAEAEQMLTDIEKSCKKESSIPRADGPKEKTKEVDSNQVSKELYGVKLMKEAKFKEAREWFTEQKLIAKAADCTALIKATRQIRAFKAEMPSVRNSHNLQLAKSHLEDMMSWREKYIQYGLDTKDLDDIIISYKSIK